MTRPRTSALPVDILLRTNEYEARAIEVLDLRYNGVWARFTREGEALATGALVHLTLQSAALPEPLDLVAVVQSRDEEGDSRCYNFEFPDQGLALQHASPLLAQANKRGAFRVQPHSSESIAMVVTTAGGDFLAEGTIDCLSASGLGIVVTDDDEVSFAPDDCLIICFTLPNSTRELRLPAIVRTRRRWTGRMRYGLEIDSERLLYPERCEEEITSYVFERQREMIHGRRKSRRRTGS